MKRLIGLVSASFLWGATMMAATPEVIKLWENGAPTSNELPVDGENNSNLDWITGVTESTMTVYPAENPNGKALLMCPGGGYFGLAFLHEGADMAKDLNDMGITLAVLKYRMPNGHHEIPADDARRALSILRSRAADWGISPDKIGIGGASAGGHLASTVATHPAGEESAVNFQVLLYPVISMDSTITHQGSRENLLGKNPSEEMVLEYSNETKVNRSTPPAFIVVSENDDVVPVENSIRYYQALHANGVPVSLHIYPTGGHGWAYRDNFEHKHIWLHELKHWLKHMAE